MSENAQPQNAQQVPALETATPDVFGSGFSTDSGSASLPPPPFSLSSGSPIQMQTTPGFDPGSGGGNSHLPLAVTVKNALRRQDADLVSTMYQVAALPPAEWNAFDRAFSLVAVYPRESGSVLAYNIRETLLESNDDLYFDVMSALREYLDHFGEYSTYIPYGAMNYEETASNAAIPGPDQVYIGIHNYYNDTRNRPYEGEGLKIELSTVLGDNLNEHFPGLLFKHVQVIGPNGSREIIEHDPTSFGTHADFIPEVAGMYQVEALIGYFRQEGSAVLLGEFEVFSAENEANVAIETASAVSYEDFRDNLDLTYGIAGGVFETEEPDDPDAVTLSCMAFQSAEADSFSDMYVSFGISSNYPDRNFFWYVMPQEPPLGQDTNFETYVEVADAATKQRLGMPVNGRLFEVPRSMSGIRTMIQLGYGRNMVAVEHHDGAGNLTGMSASYEQVFLRPGEGEGLEFLTEWRGDVEQNSELVTEDELIPVTAVWVEEVSGESQVLNLYIGPAAENPNHAVLLDFSPMADINHYRGQENSYAESWDAAFEAFRTGNHYPNGHIALSLQIPEGAQGFPLPFTDVDTNHQTFSEQLMGVGNAGLALLLTGVGLSMLSIPIAPAIAFAGATAVGVISSAGSIAYELESNDPEWGTIGTNAISIASTLFSLGGSAMVGLANDPVGTISFWGRTGKVLQMTGFGLGATEALIVDVTALVRLGTLLSDTEMSREQKQAAFASEITNLALTNGMFIIDAVGFREDLNNGVYDLDPESPTSVSADADVPGSTDGTMPVAPASSEAQITRMNGILAIIGTFRGDFSALSEAELGHLQNFSRGNLTHFLTGVTDQESLNTAMLAISKVQSESILVDLMNYDLVTEMGTLRELLARPEVINGNQLRDIFILGDYGSVQEILDAFANRNLDSTVRIGGGNEGDIGMNSPVGIGDIYGRLSPEHQAIINQMNRVGEVVPNASGGLDFLDPNNLPYARMHPETGFEVFNISTSLPEGFDMGRNIVAGTSELTVTYNGSARTAIFLVVLGEDGFSFYPLREGNVLRMPGRPPLTLDPSATTVLLGKYRDVVTGYGTSLLFDYLPAGMVNYGADAPGGISLLSIPDGVADGVEFIPGEVEFWEMFNVPYLEDAMNRGHAIQYISDSENSDSNGGYFGNEIALLDATASRHGYTYFEAEQVWRK